MHAYQNQKLSVWSARNTNMLIQLTTPDLVCRSQESGSRCVKNVCEGPMRVATDRYKAVLSKRLDRKPTWWWTGPRPPRSSKNTNTNKSCKVDVSTAVNDSEGLKAYALVGGDPVAGRRPV